MRYSLTLLSFILLLSFSACKDSSFISDSEFIEENGLKEVTLNLSVKALCEASGTRAEDTDPDLHGTENERKINDLWIFQFDETGNPLIHPHYLDVSQVDYINEGVKILLKENVSSSIYVIANIGDASWANPDNCSTLEDFKKLTLNNPKYIYLTSADSEKDFTLPMEGNLDNVRITNSTGKITVELSRMYAKVEISIDLVPVTIDVTSVEVNCIPFYCRVGTLRESNYPDTRASYPDDIWRSYSFNPGKKVKDSYPDKMILYIPENIQGRTRNSENNPDFKNENSPGKALEVKIHADYKDQFTGEILEKDRTYSIYPGENNYNDFNISRNYIYRAKLKLYTDQYNYDIPSSNCFVVKPGQTLSFLPYYRTEDGGGYDFTTYLDAKGTDETIKINNSENQLDNIQILWQTKDAIGDNSKGDRVWIDRVSSDENMTQEELGNLEYKRKIHVKAGTEPGNAVIAAYNKDGEIVWSWHIWVTGNEPDNVSNAIVYTTYAWNEAGINTSVRVPGYAVMKCNLGALAFTADAGRSPHDANGLLYQWGRKDPFPTSKNETPGSGCHLISFAGDHYKNDNKTKVKMTNENDETNDFYSVIGEDIIGGINYSIHHPTVYLCGIKKLTYNTESYARQVSNYNNNGDWLRTGESDNKLWGGLEPNREGEKKYKIPNINAYIRDNYGESKSIFDPCPSGWRVAPGDLWLGFTKTGLNPTSYSDVNTIPQNQNVNWGMLMYMQDWKKGETSYFPTQGTRLGNGYFMRTRSCGNYHNATTDVDNIVNILHIHNEIPTFRIFERANYFYYVKSVAGPIRCVRDHK